jgi:glutathione S-transferase
MPLILYGHPFSSYTWKALIPLYANGTAFEFRLIGGADAADDAFVAAASPLGKFPVLVDGGRTVFEASCIVEYLHLHHPGAAPLIPTDPVTALQVRKMDRVFDISVMDAMQEIVLEYIRSPENPDPRVGERVRDRLARAYRWIDGWLESYPQRDAITLIECAAAPSLFYADWVLQIPDELDRLRQWRAHLLALPAVKRCVDEARPYRHYFPLGAPDRD